MPELPEVETTRRGITPHISGRRVKSVTVRNASLRWPVDPQLPRHLANQPLRDIQRRGKYLLLQFDTGHLLIHLGMSGSLRIARISDAPAKHDHVDLLFDDNALLRYTDPRRFGAFIWTNEPVLDHPLLAHLGPEPLLDDFTPEYLFKRSRKRSQAIKLFIMDSHVVVGVGNIYANEALFRAGIRPSRPAGKVSKASYERLVTEIKSVLSEAIEQGGTTLRDFVGGDGKPGYFKQELAVYGRGGDACVNCGKPLKEIKLGQRATVYCTRCQH